MNQKTKEELMQMLREQIEFFQVEQDFIFLTGMYRIEYSAEHEMFVVEERSFDRIPYKEESETASEIH